MTDFWLVDEGKKEKKILTLLLGAPFPSTIRYIKATITLILSYHFLQTHFVACTKGTFCPCIPRIARAEEVGNCPRCPVALALLQRLCSIPAINLAVTFVKRRAYFPN